jgi:carbamoyltransferase
MLICGLKLTHDGSIALIENNRLLFSIEIEKLKNNPRYSSIEDTLLIEQVLNDNGYQISQIDEFVVDGWGGYDQSALALQPRLTIDHDNNWLDINNHGKEGKIKVAQYHEKHLEDDILNPMQFDGLDIGKLTFNYKSYLHVTGHVMGAYASSPFAALKQSAFMLVWDGGMYPRLYYFDVDKARIENYGPIFLLIGNIYSIFSQHFGPFAVSTPFAKDSLSVAGKVMAYIALGSVRRELFDIFDSVYMDNYDAPMGFANIFAKEFKKKIAHLDYSDEDILRTFHEYLGEMLVEKLVKKVQRTGKAKTNLCLVGGCALNIKWNSLVRNAAGFDEVYVPPFPNDSGSAIGVACAAMFNHTGNPALEWNVYSGPAMKDAGAMDGWKASECTLTELASLLHTTGEPVVFLNGRAELGPRALGNRSILAPAVSAAMKNLLNDVKKRELYRPVSPICLEEFSSEIFTPGCKDAFMLFDHYIKDGWEERIPAVRHLDGTARLQTVNKADNPQIAELLTEYYKLSGIPLLCNTSANLNGNGFFPDVESAAQWDKVNYIWSDGQLHQRKVKLSFPSLQEASATSSLV